MNEIEKAKVIFLEFLNYDINELSQDDGLEWLEFYNAFNKHTPLREKAYYKLFKKKNILRYFEELKPPIYKTNQDHKLIELNNLEIAQLYIKHVLKRYQRSILKFQQFKIKSKIRYPMSGPVPPYLLGKRCIRYDLLNINKGLFEVWETEPENFEILMWRSFYHLMQSDQNSLNNLKNCNPYQNIKSKKAKENPCGSFFFPVHKSQKLCGDKLCISRRREALRAESLS